MIEQIHDNVSVYYVREPDGELICRINGAATQYYHFDDLGSTVLMTQGLGTVTDRYDYGAWGEPRAILGGTTDNAYLYVGELGYYVHWQDSNLADALQLGVRFYEPGVGRFGQVDPIGSELVTYRYADNRPTIMTDPSGESIIRCAQDCIDRALERAQEIHEYNDKLAHCYMACRTTRCLGWGIPQSYFVPWYMSRDENDPNDIEANRRGGACARDQLKWPFRKYPSCYACCKEKVKGLPNDSRPRR